MKKREVTRITFSHAHMATMLASMNLNTGGKKDDAAKSEEKERSQNLRTTKMMTPVIKKTLTTAVNAVGHANKAVDATKDMDDTEDDEEEGQDSEEDAGKDVDYEKKKNKKKVSNKHAGQKRKAEDKPAKDSGIGNSPAYQKRAQDGVDGRQKAVPLPKDERLHRDAAAAEAADTAALEKKLADANKKQKEAAAEVRRMKLALKKFSKQADDEKKADNTKEAAKLDWITHRVCEVKAACKKASYFYDPVRKLFGCGVHVGKKIERRLKIPAQQLTERTQILIAEHDASVQVARLANAAKGVPGKVKLQRLLGMMASPTLTIGFLLVLPNHKHGNRKDGYGCPSLSPKVMGPVPHNVKELEDEPDATNLENYWQGSKMFASEANAALDPLPVWFKTRREMFADPVPHRHKKAANSAADKKNRNVAICHLVTDKDGKEHRLSYIEARQVYCQWYQHFAEESKEFAHLKTLLAEGTNLCITGYDAFDMTVDTIEDAYLDASKPFGHERVLFTMLCVQDPAEYPWVKHQTISMF